MAEQETVPPLEDPTYTPEHPPIGGIVPDVVAKWGPASQLRWFTRFQGQIKPMPITEWARFYCESEQHRGICCQSCIDDGDTWQDGICCCITLKEREAPQ